MIPIGGWAQHGGSWSMGLGLCLLLWTLLADKQEDVFAVLLDPVDLIDVGRVRGALPALHNVFYPITGAVDRVVAFLTEELVGTGIAIYVVVTSPANHRVVASPGVEQVRSCQTGDVVCTPTGVDHVIFICAYQVVGS